MQYEIKKMQSVLIVLPNISKLTNLDNGQDQGIYLLKLMYDICRDMYVHIL